MSPCVPFVCDQFIFFSGNLNFFYLFIYFQMNNQTTFLNIMCLSLKHMSMALMLRDPLPKMLEEAKYFFSAIIQFEYKCSSAPIFLHISIISGQSNKVTCQGQISHQSKWNGVWWREEWRRKQTIDNRSNIDILNKTKRFCFCSHISWAEPKDLGLYVHKGSYVKYC